jgi:hypothetical protein
MYAAGSDEDVSREPAYPPRFLDLDVAAHFA